MIITLPLGLCTVFCASQFTVVSYKNLAIVRSSRTGTTLAAVITGLTFILLVCLIYIYIYEPVYVYIS